MAAVLTGATLGIDASPFSGTAGGPPRTGQFFIAISPAATAGDNFAPLVSRLVDAIHAQDNARLPGDGRHKHRARARVQGVPVNTATLERIEKIIG